MRRKNPKTGNFFKRGDKRNDGYLFNYYIISKKTKNGFFYESWLNPKSHKERTKRERYSYKNNNPTGKGGKYRINPKTGKPWMHGETRSDGFIFTSVDKKYLTNDGFYSCNFKSKETFHRANIRKVLNMKKKKFKNVNLDLNYLLKIFPKNFVCPALNIRIKFANGITDNTATLDRINPKAGYRKGNVIWISNLANRIKTNASVEEVGKVYNWFRKINK
ncbi:hypothetical protein OA196_00530 [Candidatus Pelagibacter sp.]|nr:hypothetical protein [Candidatus Pelagibacter sp.]